MSEPLTLKLNMSKRGVINSESEYAASHDSEQDAEGEPEIPDEKPVVIYRTSSHGRKVAVKSYAESNPEEDDEEGVLMPPRRGSRSRLANFVEDDDDDEHPNATYNRRRREKRVSRPPQQTPQTITQPPSKKNQATGRHKRALRRNKRSAEEEDAYEDHPSSGGSVTSEDAPHSTSDRDLELDADGEADGEGEEDTEENNKTYALRRRTKVVNYAIPPPLEELSRPPPNKNKARGGYKGKRQGLGWSASGAELGRWMGMPADDSDSDYAGKSPKKPFGLAGAGGTGAFAGGVLPGDFAATGAPSNLGKVGDAALADADPLGVNVNVTFDEVGGLDEHIHSLKEMTLLPLLYPEVFQQFKVTPPRGVLFHGPPGTGKTLLARALAASCRSDGKKISFFMRKGADCLSKWVGEAERQLRLLFEEARACQPSIIFFDEIDGLAPVRSSKQDQIHASIVSTLLALMDGMDGRGQVIIIGATNRPDAVDPALRRPGRFDREFYFGLPDLPAREKILAIMTKDWKGWGDGENVKGLAKLTKGYGGADLRALCTEAALNAIQRRYPQIYKSQDRLILAPDTIQVELRDFMISVKKLVPSSARSSSSVATPLPKQLVPLLSSTLDRAKQVVTRVMPVEKHRTALEEAEYEDEGGLEREMLLQSMETLRVYRPRVAIHGEQGMGQAYIGAAVLHQLEGYHIQSLELGSLLSDSTRSVETAIVQLFVEAKRHRPSVIYIPSLLGWSAAVSETARSTVAAMLDTLSPTDPILLLAVVEGEFTSLPRDVRAWFGVQRETRVLVSHPSSPDRAQFFSQLLQDVQRPPNKFPEGVKRRKRVLEVLPVAPPMEPRKPTEAELALQEQSDHRTLVLLQYRLGPVLSELRRKFKRFTKRATEEYHFDFDELEIVEQAPPPPPQQQDPPPQPQVQPGPEPMVVETTEIVVTEPSLPAPASVLVNGDASQMLINGPGEPELDIIVVNQTQPIEPIPIPPPEPLPRREPLYDMDLERMQMELFNGKYLTPDDFLHDVGKILHNATIRQEEDPERLARAQAMFIATQVSVNDFDGQFRLECERMASRERLRREARKAQKKEEKEKEKAKENGELAPKRILRSDGPPPEFKMQDPVSLERRLKRQHTHSEEEHEEGAAGKRPRVDTPRIDQLTIQPSRTGSALRSNATGTPIDVRNRMLVDDVLPATNGISHLQPGPSMFPQNMPNGIHAPAPSTPRNDLFKLLNAENTEPVLSGRATPDVSHSGAPSATTEIAHESSFPPPPPRSPTPVYPDFYINTVALEQLQGHLEHKTYSLNVEQLEQLRASCLGCIWRARQEWDRTAVVHEMIKLVEDFIAEVDLDRSDSRSP